MGGTTAHRLQSRKAPAPGLTAIAMASGATGAPLFCLQQIRGFKLHLHPRRHGHLNGAQPLIGPAFRRGVAHRLAGDAVNISVAEQPDEHDAKGRIGQLKCRLSHRLMKVEQALGVQLGDLKTLQCLGQPTKPGLSKRHDGGCIISGNRRVLRRRHVGTFCELVNSTRRLACRFCAAQGVFGFVPAQAMRLRDELPSLRIQAPGNQNSPTIWCA